MGEPCPRRGTHQRPRVGRSHGHAWGIPMAVRGDVQWPPMGRMAWPSSGRSSRRGDRSPREADITPRGRQDERPTAALLDLTRPCGGARGSQTRHPVEYDLPGSPVDPQGSLLADLGQTRLVRSSRSALAACGALETAWVKVTNEAPGVCPSGSHWARNASTVPGTAPGRQPARMGAPLPRTDAVACD